MLRIFIVIFFLVPASVFALEHGGRAPELMLRSIEGNYVSLASFRGKVVIVNFWATWCPDCKKKMPYLNGLYTEYKTKGFMVLGVAVESSVPRVKDFLREHPVDFPVLMDPDGKASRAYEIFSIPTTFLIDKGGIISGIYPTWTNEQMRARLEKLL